MGAGDAQCDAVVGADIRELHAGHGDVDALVGPASVAQIHADGARALGDGDVDCSFGFGDGLVGGDEEFAETPAGLAVAAASREVAGFADAGAVERVQGGAVVGGVAGDDMLEQPLAGQGVPGADDAKSVINVNFGADTVVAFQVSAEARAEGGVVVVGFVLPRDLNGDEADAGGEAAGLAFGEDDDGKGRAKEHQRRGGA